MDGKLNNFEFITTSRSTQKACESQNPLKHTTRPIIFGCLAIVHGDLYDRPRCTFFTFKATSSNL